MSNIPNAAAKSTALRPPVGGWDTRDALADMPAENAVVMDNWFPSTDKVTLRPGYQEHAAPLGFVDFGLVTDPATESEDLGEVSVGYTEDIDLGLVT